MLTLHPAPGMGRFMPAYWTLPQNPLLLAYDGLGGLGDIVTGIYRMTDNGVVPEILARRAALEAAEAKARKAGPVGISGCGPSSCPCEVGLCGTGLNGVLDDVLASVTTATANWKTWAMVGAGVLALVMFTGGGGSQRSAELASARATYKAKVARIRAERPRRYQKYV